MTWVKIGLALLQFANRILATAHDNKMISAGEDKQIAKNLLEMAGRSAAIKEIEARFEKMTAAEVIDSLKDDFRD